jgi:drug/metabolite transporter (DMT)-like permease
MKERINQNTYGILLYILGVCALTFLVVTFKKILNEHKIPVTEAIFIRQLLIVGFLSPLMIKDKFKFFDKKALKPNFQRNALFFISTILMYIGLAEVPVNDAMTILFITPILGSIMAIYILKEKASNRLWVGLVGCFIGAVIVKKPSFNLEDKQSVGCALLLIVALIRGYVAILNKRLTKDFSVMQMLYYTHIIMLLGSTLFFREFKPVNKDVMILLLISAVGFFAEYFFVYSAYKRCSASMLQPLDFFKLIFSMIFSYLILKENVTTNQVIGGIVVVIAYIYSISGKTKSKKV